MNLIWSDLRLPVDLEETEIPYLMAKKMKVSPESLKNWKILRRSIDARKKPQLYYVYTIEFFLDAPWPEMRRAMVRVPQLREKPEIQEYTLKKKPDKKLVTRPIVVGTGPAGYFAAYFLAEKGYKPLVLERGDEVQARTKAVENFWKTGNLDPESNVQFGEGGAGTFSDGKLTTRIDHPLVKRVLEDFVEFGANKEILYSAKPHIGTDVLKKVVSGMRQRIVSLGGEVVFRSKVTGIRTAGGRLEGVEINDREFIPAETVILAVGHSARDVYLFLKKQGVSLEAKSFAMGLRIEHSQKLINLAQYGVENHPSLGPADYQLTYKDQPTGRGAYTFCMCPGGTVNACSSEEGGVVTNGMSEYARDSGIANSAVVVTVNTSDFLSHDPLAGVDLQREWERKAFQVGGGNYLAPAQTAQDFLNRRISESFYQLPSYRPGYNPSDLHSILPVGIGEVLARALLEFDKKIKGFAGQEATLTGIESRTSAPVRILRDDSGQSINLKGLFPAGEGAGYAGGITSSAVDGLRAAEKLMEQYLPWE